IPTHCDNLPYAYGAHQSILLCLTVNNYLSLVLTRVVLCRSQRKNSIQPCGQKKNSCFSFDNYCFNNGQCMFLVDLNENTCKCELGFRGSRCEQLLLVSKPMGETQKAFIIVCVILLIIGLTGALYFFCKWYMGWDSNLVGWGEPHIPVL
uniref:EGF-like domain-containing protein n=1 Tax=Neogobius melanostomus TaxID=47308 RepID=A0A8C6V108_9GOBI